MKQTLAPRKVTPAPRERGAALIISLILLVLITLISVASLRSTNSLKTDELKVGQNLDVPATTLAGQP